ncbi:MAG: hypothetical protein IJB41_02525 [Clostridia bacterium]|nr:hypothetical protein [Clostridia bacterium]
MASAKHNEEIHEKVDMNWGNMHGTYSECADQYGSADRIVFYGDTYFGPRKVYKAELVSERKRK